MYLFTFLGLGTILVVFEIFIGYWRMARRIQKWSCYLYAVNNSQNKDNVGMSLFCVCPLQRKGDVEPGFPSQGQRVICVSSLMPTARQYSGHGG